MNLYWAARPAGLGETGWVGSWSPGIGDPTFLGWVTVVAYFVAAWLCYSVSTPILRERLLWRVFVVLLVALGINKQLDLQSAMTEFVRSLAREQGWYDVRHQFQAAFIEVLFVLGLLAGASLLAFTWRLPRTVKVAGIGLCFVGCYVLIRASLFHNMGNLFRHEELMLRLNWVFELGGIGIICLGASWRAAQLRKASGNVAAASIRKR